MQSHLFADPPADRRAMLARWTELMRIVLPAMAERHDWPIRLDHCFMRVCLDAAVGAPWTATVKRPAVRHMSDAAFATALRIAESLIADPARLPPLNRASLAGRRIAREHRRASAAARSPDGSRP